MYEVVSRGLAEVSEGRSGHVHPINVTYIFIQSELTIHLEEGSVNIPILNYSNTKVTQSESLSSFGSLSC